MKTPRLLLFGMDGLSWKILDPIIDTEELPNFRKIRETMVCGTLRSTIPTATIPALPALYTGTNPGELGIFFFRLPSGNVPNLTNVVAPRLWTLTGRAGKRSLIVNLRFTYPPEKMEGLMVSGPPLPHGEPLICNLEDRNAEILETYNPRRIFSLNQTLKDGHRTMVDRAVNDMWERYEKFKELSGEERFDLMWYWLEVTDYVQHRIFHDRENIVHFFKQVDDLLGDVLEHFGNCNIIFHSDHGFHEEPTLRFHVNTWLEREGFLRIKGNPLTSRLTILMQWFARNYVPSSLIKKFLSMRQGKKASSDELPPADKEATPPPSPVKDCVGHGDVEIPYYEKPLENYPGIDYALSRAYMVDSWGIDIVGGGGTANPDYEETRRSLMERMRDARDEDGEPYFQMVSRKEDVFKGRCLHALPDIIFLVNSKYISEHQLSFALHSQVKGKVKERRNHQGGHSSAPEGFLAATGPDIRAREPDLKESGLKESGIEHSVLDIFPTALYLMDAPLPGNLGGKPMSDLVKKEKGPVFLDNDDAGMTREERADISDSEKEQMVESLKAMGYIDI